MSDGTVPRPHIEPGDRRSASIASTVGVWAGTWRGWVVANITVRNLDDEVHRRLKQRAATHGRSMEAEARAILTSALARGGLARAWLDATGELRGPDVTLPPRTAPRQVDLG